MMVYQEYKPTEINLQTLLKKYLEQGFTLKTLGKITQVPTECLIKIVSNIDYVPTEEFEQRLLSYLYIFLIQLYNVTPSEQTFFSEILTSLIEYFGASYDAVANYLNISTADLKVLVDSSNILPNSEDYKLKLMHLYTTFIRDKRFSFE